MRLRERRLFTDDTVKPSIDLDFSKTPQIDPRLTFTRSTTATCMAYSPAAVAGDLPILTICAINEVRFTNARRVSQGVWSSVLNDGSAIPVPITLLVEEARTNLLLNSAIPGTQNITTTAQTYSVSMGGTGTCTLTGTATGTLTGTGSTVRTSLTVTATAGTLTLIFSGTNTNGQAEAGPTASSYIPTVGAAITRTVDTPSFTGTGLSSWYNPTQGTFVLTASGQYSSAPGNIGVWNPLLTGSGSYAITYDKRGSNSAYLYTPNAAAGVTPLEYQDIPTPTTVLLCEQGIANISRFTYYPKALKIGKVAPLVNGTLTTAFDTSYAATTSLLHGFDGFPYSTMTRYFPKINTGNVTTLQLAWYYNNLLPSFPLINTSKVTNWVNTFGSCGWAIMPLLDTSAGTDFTQMCVNFSALTTIPAGFFTNAKSKYYGNAFINCALTQASVDNILVSIARSVVNTPSLTNGTLNMTGGTSAAPSATGLAAKAALVAAGWTVTHN
jgi:hypothetical protein